MGGNYQGYSDIIENILSVIKIIGALTALDHNSNVSRKNATTADGSSRYNLGEISYFGSKMVQLGRPKII